MSFSISRVRKEGLEILILRDDSGGCEVEILPDFGAMLHGFRIRGTGEMVDLIESYSSLEELEAGIENSYRGSKLSPFVCRVREGVYEFDGKTFHLEKRNGRGESIHGLLYDRPFEIQETKAGKYGAEATLLNQYEGADPGFPFPFTCEVRYNLPGSNKLHLYTRITNQSSAPMPLVDGWHPYFRTGSRADQLELEFPVRGVLEFDPDLIPTGRILPAGPSIHLDPVGGLSMDQSFLLDWSTANPSCRLKDRDRGITILLTPGPGYPFLNVYIPPSRTSIALEPLSGAPDAFNNKIGLMALSPGDHADFSLEIRGNFGPG